MILPIDELVVNVQDPPHIDEDGLELVEQITKQIEANPKAFNGPKLLCLEASSSVINVYHANYAWRLAHIQKQQAGKSEFGLGSLGVLVYLEHQGQTLWCKRSMNLMVHPGVWSCSASGGVDPGEDLLEAATRETKEELGIDVVLQPKLIAIDESVGGVVVVFSGQTDSKEVMVDPEEIDEVRWLENPDELTSLPQIIKDVHQRLKHSSANH